MVSQSTSDSLLCHIWKAWTDIGICISVKLPFWYSLSCFRDKWQLLIFHLNKSLIFSSCSGFQRPHFCSNSHVIAGVWLDAFFRHTSLDNSFPLFQNLNVFLRLEYRSLNAVSNMLKSGVFLGKFQLFLTNFASLLNRSPLCQK